jgi:uncharacterized protein YbjT (DUF2867 family)
MNAERTVFITGITGNQGGAIAQQLLEKGYEIMGLTRNTQSEKAQTLQERGITLIKGDLTTPKTYHSAIERAGAVFFVQALTDKQTEVKEAIQFINTLKEKGVKHLVYSSVLGADLNTGIPHFESKNEIEQYIKAMGIEYTILRPASFYENYLYPQVYNGIKKGKFVSPLNKYCKQQMIGVAHIGKIGSLVIESSDKYQNKTIEIATDEYDMAGVAEVFSEVLQQPVKYQRLPGLFTRLFMGSQLYKMFKYMNQHEFCEVNNIQAVREEFNIQSNFRDWVVQYFRD